MKKFRTRKNIYLVLCILWVCAIWGHSMQVADESNVESGWWLNLANGLLGFFHLPELTMNFIRKVAHFTEYFILGWLATLEYLACRKEKMEQILAPFFGCLLVAQCDETIQLFVEGRAGMVQDVWLDFAGSICAILIVLFISKK